MERLALRRLLKDIEAGQIDILVVCKVDRLIRRLADFPQLVRLQWCENFELITQQFKKTTSTEWLLLNNRLSFAQLEHEVTDDLIRDKSAAEKAKGTWMGGEPPSDQLPPLALICRAIPTTRMR